MKLLKKIRWQLNYRILKKFPKKWEIIRKIGNQNFIFNHTKKLEVLVFQKGLKILA